jgi:ABC-type transport system substrate-binding protein
MASGAGSRIGDYLVARELGHGGMGTVFLARDEALDRLVAVKVVTPAVAYDERFRERFLRESRLAARLEHPSIVPVYYTGEDGGRLYLAMRYVPGGTLADRLAAGPVEPAAAVAMLQDVAGALDAAHAAGLVHRDVKPGNVLLDGGRALLADFGLARGAASVESLSREEGFSGTVGYIAPEQIEGDAVTGQADQYALGCIAFECLTGQAPFVRDSEVAAIYAHLSDPPPRVSSITPLGAAVDRAIGRALAKRPGDRFETCSAFTTALAEALQGAASRPSHRRRWFVAAGAVVVAAGVAAGVLATRGSGPAPVPRPDALVALDASGHVSDVVPLGQRPTAITTAPDGIWVALAGAYQVVRVDRKTRQITQIVSVGGVVNGLAYADGSIWATLDSGRDVLRIDPASGQPGQPSDVANGPGAIAVTKGSLWIASRLDGTVSQFDIASGRVVRAIPIGAGVSAVLAAFGSVWATSEDQASVTRIDPASGAVIETIPVGHSPVSLAATRDSLWIANRSDGTVSRLDPATNSVVGLVRVGQAPGTVAAAGPDAVLVGDDDTGSIFRLSATGSAGARVENLHATAAALLAVDRGVLATTVGLPSSHRGGVLRIADGDLWWAMDPAMDPSNPPTWIWDTLVRYRRTSGSAGFDLVPDLAQSIPRSADGGRTWVFHVRRAIRYSTGVEVRPSDFVLAFERDAVGRFQVGPGNGVDPDGRTGAYGDGFGGIVGFQACADRVVHELDAEARRRPSKRGPLPPTSCDLSRGVVPDDAARTVTFHLTEADPDFPRKLTATASAPVPPGTPVNGAWNQPVPGTGPYVMASQTLGKELVERRNPYFHVWSADARPDGNPDEILFLLSNPAAKQVQMIQSGQADGNFWEVPRTALEPLTRDHPSQLYLTPLGLGPVWSFDTSRSPLNSADVRRAINFAVDRPAMARAAAFTTTPTCQTVPIGRAGYAPYCPYGTGGTATGGPDVARARALVRRAGATGARVTVSIFAVSDPTDFRSRLGPIQRLLIQAIRRTGLVPVVHAYADWKPYFDANPQIAQAFFDPDPSRPAAAAGIDFVTAGCDPDAIRHGAFCDADTKRLLAAANAATDPIAQARAWAELDHHLTDVAAWLPIGNGLDSLLLSKRTRNAGMQPALGGELWELMTVR